MLWTSAVSNHKKMLRSDGVCSWNYINCGFYRLLLFFLFVSIVDTSCLSGYIIASTISLDYTRAFSVRASHHMEIKSAIYQNNYFCRNCCVAYILIMLLILASSWRHPFQPGSIRFRIIIFIRNARYHGYLGLSIMYLNIQSILTEIDKLHRETQQ